MIGEAAIELPALSVCHWKRLGMLGNAIPNGFNKLDALLDAEAKDFFNLCRAHMWLSLRLHLFGCNRDA